MPGLIDDAGDLAALRRITEDEAIIGGMLLQPLLGTGSLLPLGEIGVGLVDDVGGQTELMLTGAGIGDLFGGQVRSFFDTAVALLHDTDNLVVKELLLERLRTISRADHGKARVLGPTVLHHVPADGSTARIQLVFFDDGVELGNIAFLKRRGRAHDGQEVQLKVIQPLLLLRRKIGQSLHSVRIACVFVPGIRRELFQRIHHQETGAMFGAAIGLNLQKHLNQKARGDRQNYQQDGQDDLRTEGLVYG